METCALIVAGLVTAWLLPAALEDYRTMRVSLKWTLPLFAAAFPAGLILGNFPFVIAMLVSFLIALALPIGLFICARPGWKPSPPNAPP